MVQFAEMRKTKATQKFCFGYGNMLPVRHPDENTNLICEPRIRGEARARNIHVGVIGTKIILKAVGVGEIM